MEYDKESLAAAEQYQRLKELLRKHADKSIYHELYGLLRQICEEQSEGKVFSNLFSLLGWICDSHSVDKRLTIALQNLRRRAYRATNIDKATFLHDVRILADFIEHLYEVPMPDALKRIAPADYKALSQKRMAGKYKVLRVRVKNINDDCIFVQPDSKEDDGELLCLLLIDAEHGSNYSYLREIVDEGSTLNLLNVNITESATCLARWIIYEPDFLMSPSELAAVFEPNAVLPQNYFLRNLQPKESTYYTLLGLVSGQMLDDLVFQTEKHKADYAETIRKVFCRYPLDFSLLMNDKEMAVRFHNEAQMQFVNIKHLVEHQLEMIYGFKLDQALLEPSFVCPAVGLAGRMDYLQTDGHCLIEQKSGKRDEFRNTHKEPHYVQMMLYQLMIEFSMGLAHDECRAYLLYSHYADGLMMERPYMQLLRQAIEMRNRIVAQFKCMAEGKTQDFFESLNVDDFRQRNVSDKLWQGYVRPRLEETIAPFRSSEPRSKAFFYRFYTFLAKEQWLARMGNADSGAHGYADLWNNPALVRAEGGDMYADLHICRLEDNKGSGGIDTIVFNIDEQHSNKPTNFRRGDTVQIYAYDKEESEPNVIRQFTLRGRLADIRHNEVEIRLSNAQRNKHIFSNAHMVFALEHDRVEAMNSMLINGLYSLLTASEEIQRRFFLLYPTKADCNITLHDDYGAFSELVTNSVVAKELFLVIGPPGSGKTSRALRYMIEEHLHRLRNGKLLIMAYTNRAVDELCAMLEEIVKESPDLLNDYLRIGNELSTAETLRPRLLHNRAGNKVKNIEQVLQLIRQTHIIVGSTTAIMQQLQLLKGLQIEAAFVDEASQILEPYILPFFTIGTIDKFILVGDQKQLPAVVMQNRSDSAITDKSLNEIGIKNCSDSVFDRMLHRLISLQRSDLYIQIRTQGRMHPQLYEFVNEHFYRGQLNSVPLRHQQRSIEELYPHLPRKATALTQLLATQRIFFIDCCPMDDGVNDKVNSVEAEVITDCIVSLSDLYEANARRLEAQSIGIIVPYRNQIGMIRSKIMQRGLLRFAEVSIDTVERYQGSQRDIILYSFTARHASQLNFLTSATYLETDSIEPEAYPVDRKLNVALTRAKEQIVLVGNGALLQRNKLFMSLIDCLPKFSVQNN